LAIKLANNPQLVRNDVISVQLDVLQQCAVDLNSSMVNLILEDWMTSYNSQAAILELVLQCDQVLNPLY
jgi:hypothetical protein